MCIYTIAPSNATNHIINNSGWELNIPGRDNVQLVICLRCSNLYWVEPCNYKNSLASAAFSSQKKISVEEPIQAAVGHIISIITVEPSNNGQCWDRAFRPL